MRNDQVARVLDEIGDILEIQGENRFRVMGYRRGSEAIRNLGRDINEIWQAGELDSIPGIGQALSQKLDELHAQVPAGVAGLTAIPDVGPAKARALWEKLGITSIEGVEEAARSGKLRDLQGFGAKTEQKILAGIKALQARSTSGRIPLGEALPAARGLLDQLLALAPGIQQSALAGSLRRWRDTIGDVDLLVAATDPEPIMQVFRTLPQVGEVLLSGSTKTSVRLHSAMQVDLRVLDPARWGTALQYFTGSQAHNVELRELALRQGWSLNEYEMRSTRSAEVRLCANEGQVYAALGLPVIPPELREGRGEIAAAQRGQLPALVGLDEMQGELHAHTTWSDGRSTTRQMAEAALARGYRYFAFTDHSQSLGVTGGMSAEAWHRQRLEIEEVRAEYPGLLILQGAEVEVRADGTLDYSDELLAEMDIVVAALHSSQRQPREQITERALKVLRNPHVDVLAHPSGRLIGRRDASELDLDRVLATAAETGTVVEINANPLRLDLDDLHVRRAGELGVLLAINTDAHAPGEMAYLEYGVNVARRGWATTGQIVNAWAPEALLEYLRHRKRPRA